MQCGKFDDNKDGNSYFFGLDKGSRVANVLKEYDESNEMKFYSYKNFIYIIVSSEENNYIIDTSEKEFIPEELVKEIEKSKKILFGIIENETEVEKFYIYDIIF